MPRRIAGRPSDDGTEPAQLDPTVIMLEREFWSTLHPDEPPPDFTAMAHEWRRQHPPGEPIDFTTPEGLMILAQARAVDDELRAEGLKRNEEPK